MAPLASLGEEATNLAHFTDGARCLSQSYLPMTPDCLKQFPKNVKIRKTLWPETERAN